MSPQPAERKSWGGQGEVGEESREGKRGLGRVSGEGRILVGRENVRCC